jgi:crotonobetainyl-CoA:carnitine CoA-transferase CaiB-like acyl-CoA transferase
MKKVPMSTPDLQTPLSGGDSAGAAVGSGPLAGVRIVDLTTIVLGPLATLTLAGLGAEVIKIEAPDGDNVRNAGVTRRPNMGHVFLHGNRGKQSLVLDLKIEAAREALLRILEDADVFVSNVRPAAMKRLGLGIEALQQVNPRLIQITACGYGSAGPYADKPAYDDLIQGAVGIPWLNRMHGSSEPRYVPLSLADRVSGLHVVYAVTAALYARERTGVGQHVEVPMFESLAHFVLADHLAGKTFEPELGPAGYDRLLSQNRRPYATADGHLCVLIYNDKQWRSFLAAIGQPERFEDDRFRSQRQRSVNIDFIYGWVGEVMATRTTSQWCDVLTAIDVPHQVPNSIDDLLADPHLLATGFLSSETHPTEGTLRTLGNPTVWSGTPTGSLSPAPNLGEHSLSVLARAGYSAQEIDALIAAGAAMVQ